jgi:long-chain acyl-CoA synthetase
MWSLRTDDGVELPWSAAEMRRRSLLAAWRLRARGLQPGDRLLTWSPSTPRLPAVYWGAMRAGVIVVPLDLRMTTGVITRISARAETQWLAVDSGLDAPDPASVGLDHFTVWRLEELVADPDEAFPADWEAQAAAWPAPTRDSLFEVIFTSGTTADPKGVMLTHGNILANVAGCRATGMGRPDDVFLSFLPLSHMFERTGGYYLPLALGAGVAFARGIAQLAEDFATQRPTAIFAVPRRDGSARSSSVARRPAAAPSWAARASSTACSR